MPTTGMAKPPDFFLVLSAWAAIGDRCRKESVRWSCKAQVWVGANYTNCAAPEYLLCIFRSSLTGAMPWQHTWSTQILSTLAWARWDWPATTHDYTRIAVMRVLHKAVCRVYSASLWSAESTHYAGYTQLLATSHVHSALLSPSSYTGSRKCTMARNTLHRHHNPNTIPA